MKLERLEIRLPPYEKTAIERQAAAAEMSVSAYVRHRLVADLTGDALAEKIAALVTAAQDAKLESIRDGQEAAAATFDVFRAGLRKALNQVHDNLMAEVRGGKK